MKVNKSYLLRDPWNVKTWEIEDNLSKIDETSE